MQDLSIRRAGERGDRLELSPGDMGLSRTKVQPRMSYATFGAFKDGLIVNYREYWNPLAFMQAMDGARF